MNRFKRIAAILAVNVALLLALEGAFRVLPLTPRTTFFIPSKTPGEVVSNRSFFDPRNNFSINDVRIKAKKDPTHLRIFMTGDSTAAGLHYNPHASITRFMEEMLKDLLPQKTFEVINAGLGGKSSDTVLRVFREILAYEPDVIIVYSGQNEFLEPRVMEFREKRLHPHITEVRRLFNHSAAFTALRETLERRHDKRPPVPHFENNMMGESFAGADFSPIVNDYRQNLLSMGEAARTQKVPLVFSTLVSDIRDWEPNVSYFSMKNISAKDRERFVLLLSAAKTALDEKRLDDAISSLREAEKIDFYVAELQWQRARALEQGLHDQAAYDAYSLAETLDGKPWRNLPEFNTFIAEIAQRTGALLYDAHTRFRAESPKGLIGKNLIIDNCHPDLHGQFLIARGLLATLANANVLAPLPEWRLDLLQDEMTYRQKLISDPKVLAESYFRTGSYILSWALLRYEKTRRLEQALGNFDEAIKVFPAYAEALYGKAQTLRALGKPGEAEIYVQKARALKPSIDQEVGYLRELVEPLAAIAELPHETKSVTQAR